MPSVGFCNLGEAYGDNWKKQSKPKDQVAAAPADSGKMIKHKQGDNTAVQQKPMETPINNLGNQPGIPGQTFRQSMNSCPNCTGNLPKLPTFQNAEGCMLRNNQFQNQVSAGSFQLPMNPLNPNPNVNFLNTGTPMVTQQPYLSQTMMSPHMMDFNQMPQMLPIPNQMNTWPPQRWVVDPNGPAGYESYDPFSYGGSRIVNPYNMTPKNYDGVSNINGNIRENFNGGPRTFSRKFFEFFGANTNDQGVLLLQIVLFILVIMFIVQLVEIIVENSPKPK